MLAVTESPLAGELGVGRTQEGSGVGFDLTSDSGKKWQFRTHGWSLLLRIAEAYDWVADKTLPPSGVAAAEWEGGYDTNDGQHATAAATASLAAALERMLGDPHRVERVHEVEVQLEA